MSVVAGMVTGMVTHLVWGRARTRWLWLIASGVYALLGVLVSEVWFGWATEEELQPNIDGLSFDEVLLIGTVLPFATVAVARLVSRHRGPPPVRGGHGRPAG
jgi:hypothetical protein